MPYVILYHPEVKEDLRRINARMKDRIRNAIEQRLTTAPERYGAPLRKTLKGYWKLRVGDYRVVFKTTGTEVIVLAILHRSVVYQMMGRRMQ